MSHPLFLLCLCLFSVFNAYFAPTVSAYACYEAPSGRLLPLVSHCQDLIEAIAYVSHQPGWNDLKVWGRHLVGIFLRSF